MTDHDKKLAINYEQFEKEIHVAHIVKTLRTLNKHNPKTPKPH